MKKGAVLFVFLFLFSLTFFTAEIKDCAEGNEDCKIDNARSCLNDKINEKECENLSPEEKVFSLMAVGKCNSEVKDDSKYESEIKYTAQAYLGGAGKSKSFFEDKNRTSVGIDWFLEIESPVETKCDVEYSSSNEIEINKDKKIDYITGGSCLSVSSNGYWIKISEDCYDEEFEISCDQQFLTTLLYQKNGDDTIYVSEKASSASAEGTTSEKVSSLCFSQSPDSCDYEGTLWAALALSEDGKDITPYLPYLITMDSDNDDLLPEAFLYFLTGNAEFKNNLLSKQINSKWWVSLNDRYYGTALALKSFQYEEPLQKKDSVNWLLNEAQEENGCWDSGSIRNTAFLLYSISPKSTSSGTGSGGCESSGFFCTSQLSCSGQVLDYSCSGAFVCCSEDTALQTCSEQTGEICSSNQICSGTRSSTTSASGLSSGQVCCLNGACQEPTTTPSACEAIGGECRVNTCLSGEEKNFESCEFRSDVCCVPEKKTETNYFWVWLFGILIILVILGIVFKEKLRPYWIRIKSKFGKFGSKGKFSQSPRSPPPGAIPGNTLRRVQPRRVSGSVGRHGSTKQRPRGEIDDVLKKLKEMSK